MIFTRAVCRHLFTQKQPIYCRRLFASEVDGAGTSTGIEHALKFKQVGMTNKRDFDKEYKCAEYLYMNKYSYYDVECEMFKHRAPQPSNKRPDTEPKFKEQPHEEKPQKQA